MKRKSFLLLAIFSVAALFSLTSCEGVEDIVNEQENIEAYKNDIVGYWQIQNKREFWRFDKFGTGTLTIGEIQHSVGNGENWDEADDIKEGEEGTNKFSWFFEKNGLQIIYRLETSDVLVPEPDASFLITHLSSDTMIWVTDNGYGTRQILLRTKQNRQ